VACHRFDTQDMGIECGEVLLNCGFCPPKLLTGVPRKIRCAMVDFDEARIAA
jgi:hypothetical protein